MNGKYNQYLVCDDLISNSSIDKELIKEKFPVEIKGKVISGTFGSFNINDMPDSFRKRIQDGDISWKTLFQQQHVNLNVKLYRYISHALDSDFPFGTVVDLELSVSANGRMIIVKSPYKNKFQKIYKNYKEFLTEWEEIDAWPCKKS